MSESKVDDTLLRYADSKSPEEISRMLSGMISPEQVAARTKALLKSRDWLEEKEQERLVFYKLRALLASLEGQHLDLANAKVQLALIKQIFDRLDVAQQRSDDILDRYNANVGRAMIAAYDIALAHIGGAIRDVLPLEEWTELKREALVLAAEKVAEKQIAA